MDIGLWTFVQTEHPIRGDVVSKRLESRTEKNIREAIEKGEFDNLPGKGQPLDLSENPLKILI